jgi:nickel-dependent lactate racemase
MRKILIVVPDVTRKAHLKEVLPGLLRRFVPRNDVKIIVATGLHKPHTRAELKNLVGKKIFSNYDVMTHTQEKNDLIYRGRTRNGIPIVLNKNLFEADKIVTIGLIEPHLYAGYSGGAKTIAIGLAGEQTINATHHPRFLDNKRAAIGSVKDNPFQDCLWEIIRGLPVKYSINIVNDREGNLKKVFCGDLRTSYAAGVGFAKKIFEEKLNKVFDAVICGVNPPKDVNMYQASRAFNYILNAARPVVKKGGMVLVRASLRDGFGRGTGEKRFAAVLKKMRSPGELIKKVRSGGCVAGEHRAYMVAQAMLKARLGFIGPRAAFYTKGLPFLSFPDEAAALNFVKKAYGKKAGVYKVKNILSLIVSR